MIMEKNIEKKYKYFFVSIKKKCNRILYKLETNTLHV